MDTVDTDIVDTEDKFTYADDLGALKTGMRHLENQTVLANAAINSQSGDVRNPVGSPEISNTCRFERSLQGWCVRKPHLPSTRYVAFATRRGSELS